MRYCWDKLTSPRAELRRGWAPSIAYKGDRHEEALEAYRQGLEISPMNVGALSGMGHVLKTIGRQEEAIAAFRQCIKANPAYGETYWSLANLKTFEFNSEEVGIMEDLVERKSLADEPKVNMLVSLGKHYENEKKENHRGFV